MPPKEAFYTTDLSPETLIAADEWEKVKQPILHYYKGEPTTTGHLYPAEVITANGHHLLGIIELSSLALNGGTINIPFGIWNASRTSEIEERLAEKAIEMGVVKLLDKKSDSEKLDILGLDSEKKLSAAKIPTGGSFSYTMSRTTLTTIQFITELGSEKLTLKGERPANGIRVEGLVQDFMSAFPGWQIQPMSL